MLDFSALRRIQRLSGWVLLAALLFSLFFQVNKSGQFGAISPFAVDPYDAVGSFGFQLALFIGLLTYARTWRMQLDPEQAVKCRLVLRGLALTLITILVTLVADTIAVFQSQEVMRNLLGISEGRILLIELIGLFILTLACGIVVLIVFAPLRLPEPPGNLTPADGIDDFWALARMLVNRAGDRLPLPFVERVNNFNSERLFGHLPWIDPRRHPWRFAAALGLLAGVALLLVQLTEGLPPSHWDRSAPGGDFRWCGESGYPAGIYTIGSLFGAETVS